jgi:hypothetical protein
MSLRSLELWGHWGAPNPWKVAMILETLDLPYTIYSLELNEVKTDSYLAMTPNGRLPTLKDPNTGLVLWEVSTHSVLLGPPHLLTAVRRHHTIPGGAIRHW